MVYNCSKVLLDLSRLSNVYIISVNWATIGLDNGLSPVKCQLLSQPTRYHCWWDPHEQIPEKCETCHTRNRFEVISYPFPQSNVHSMLGYSTYYSQLIRFFRLCNNINDFSFRAKFSYSKLVKPGYKHNLLLKYFKKFCSAYNIEGKYGEKNSDLLFSRMLKHNPFVSCNINNTKEINDIVKASCVKIMPLTRSVECEWRNRSPLPTNVSDTVNAPPPPYTLDIDDSGGNNSCSLSDVAECSIILDKNTPPSEFLPDYNTVYTSGDTRIFSQSHPLPLITEHKHPFGLKNPKFQCFFNSVLQLIFSIFRNNSYTSPFNSSTEGTLLKCMLQTAHNAYNSKDVDALKFQLVRHDIFYNGQNQQDSTECLLMLINIIDKGSMPDSSSTTSPMGASLSDLLFSFVLEKYILQTTNTRTAICRKIYFLLRHPHQLQTVNT